MLTWVQQWFVSHKVRAVNTGQEVVYTAMLQKKILLRLFYDPVSDASGRLSAFLAPVPFERARQERFLEQMLGYNRTLVSKEGYGVRAEEFLSLEARLYREGVLVRPEERPEVWLERFLNHACFLHGLLCETQPLGSPAIKQSFRY